MTHEPECPNLPEHFVPEDSILWSAVCHCDTIRAAYQRGRQDSAKSIKALFRTSPEPQYDEIIATALGLRYAVANKSTGGVRRIYKNAAEANEWIDENNLRSNYYVQEINW